MYYFFLMKPAFAVVNLFHYNSLLPSLISNFSLILYLTIILNLAYYSFTQLSGNRIQIDFEPLISLINKSIHLSINTAVSHTLLLQFYNHMWQSESEVKSLSPVRLSATPWTVAYQAPPSMGFSRQECWSGLPFHSPGDLPNPGIEPRSPSLQAEALPPEPPGKPLVTSTSKS